jgi:bacteriocin biosynthesis cyclodehydratase domain-containing protein
VRRLWRDRETLQLGRAPGRAVVLAGLDESTRSVLPLLDGTRNDAQLLADAAARGCPPERTAVLLELLDGAGALADAAAAPAAAGDRGERERLTADTQALSMLRGRAAPDLLARRRTARVRVVGAGRVGAAVAGLLACAGVGALDVDDLGLVRPQDTGPCGPDLADVGRSRGEAVRERLSRLAPSVDRTPAAVHLVVLCPPDGTGVDVHRDVLAGGVAHLVAEVRDTVGVVGPLVLPGRSACLHCLELARADRDPDWPALAAQLSQPPRSAPASDVVLSAAVAATAAGQVLAALDDGGVPETVGATLELALPAWRWRRRSWAAHPHCGCVRAAG